ncbi:MAG: MBG domain-containing protein, partial [Candidatus Omnitrophota bacterium]
VVENTATGGLAVGKATLTVTPDGSKTKTYGDVFSAFTGVISGIKNSDAITATYTSTGAVATADVASYDITVSSVTGAKIGNYTVVENTATGGLAVGKATLTITANDTNKTYGTAITGASGSTAFGSSGLKNGETIGSVTIAYGTGAATTDNVATYGSQVTPSAATGGTFASGNYSITYAKGAIVVDAAPLTVTADNQTKTFGSTFTFTGSEFTSSGLKNGETIGSVTLTSAGAPAAAPVSGSPYTIVPSVATGGTFTASNYTITYANGSLTISELPPPPPTPGNETATNQQLAAFEIPRFPLPGVGDMTTYQVNTFTPQVGPVYFYQPPTPYDMAAFDMMMFDAGNLQFLNGFISLLGHEGLMPGLDDRRRLQGVS